MLALDIAADGVLLCGRGDYWTEYKKAAARYVREAPSQNTHGVVPTAR